MDCKFFIEEIDYYFSLLHGGKIDEERVSSWFLLDKMMEAIYYASEIGESYGLPSGEELLEYTINMLRKKINDDIMPVKEECLSLDSHFLVKIREITNNLKLLLQSYNEINNDREETGHN